MYHKDQLYSGAINHFAMPERRDHIYESLKYNDKGLYTVLDTETGDEYTFQNELYSYSLSGIAFIKYGCKGELITISNEDRLHQAEFESHNRNLIYAMRTPSAPISISHMEPVVVPYNRLYTHTYHFTGEKTGYEIGYFLHMMEGIGHYIIARTLKDIYGNVTAIGDDGLKPMSSNKITDLLKRRKRVFSSELILNKPHTCEIFVPCRADENDETVGDAISISPTEICSLLGKLSEKILEVQKKFIINENLDDFGVSCVYDNMIERLTKYVKLDTYDSFMYDIPDIQHHDLMHISNYIPTMRASGKNRTIKGTTNSGAAPIINCSSAKLLRLKLYSHN